MSNGPNLSESSQGFTLSLAPHAVFGQLITLTIGTQPMRRLTQREAVTLALALTAVANRRSDAPEIYLSPIASDCNFAAQVEADGIVIATEEGASASLGWPATRELATKLADLTKASSSDAKN